MTDPFIVVVAIVTVIILMGGWVLSGVWHRSQEGLRELREEIAELKNRLESHSSPERNPTDGSIGHPKWWTPCSKQSVTHLDHSSAAALLADLGRHQDCRFRYEFTAGNFSDPWRLASSSRGAYDDSVSVSCTEEGVNTPNIPFDRDQQGRAMNTHYDFSLNFRLREVAQGVGLSFPNWVDQGWLWLINSDDCQWRIVLDQPAEQLDSMRDQLRREISSPERSKLSDDIVDS